MRRLPGLLLLCSSLALIAAAAPPRTAPSPKATASPLATPTLSPLSQAPVVLVYPFDVQTGVDPKIGMAIAQIIAQEMKSAGGIAVPAVPQNVKRPDFLSYARAQHADFYLGGYVTPVGDSAAVVEQVVSVDSGIILFSQTAQVSTVADVASQSLQARAQILAFVGRSTENVETQSANTPAPTSSNGTQVPIKGLSNIVNSVFRHKGGKDAPAPLPSEAAKPQRGVIVARVTATGAVSAADITNASDELYFAMNRRFSTQMTNTTTSVAQSANAICGPNRDNTIATGTVAKVQERHKREQVVFTLQIYTCFGDVLDSAIGKGGTVKAAVDSAVTAYAAAHPENS